MTTTGKPPRDLDYSAAWDALVAAGAKVYRTLNEHGVANGAFVKLGDDHVLFDNEDDLFVLRTDQIFEPVTPDSQYDHESAYRAYRAKLNPNWEANDAADEEARIKLLGQTESAPDA